MECLGLGVVHLLVSNQSELFIEVVYLRLNHAKPVSLTKVKKFVVSKLFLSELGGFYNISVLKCTEDKTIDDILLDVTRDSAEYQVDVFLKLCYLCCSLLKQTKYSAT